MTGFRRLTGLRSTEIARDLVQNLRMGLLNFKEVEAAAGSGRYAPMIAAARAAGRPVPGIWHLFAFKPDATEALGAFTQAVMRGPSPLSSGFRELIAAFTSYRNRCKF